MHWLIKSPLAFSFMNIHNRLHPLPGDLDQMLQNLVSDQGLHCLLTKCSIKTEKGCLSILKCELRFPIE